MSSSVGGPKPHSRYRPTLRGQPAAIEAYLYGDLQSSNDNLHSAAEPGPACELDCLRDILAPSILKAAEERAVEAGLGADQVLVRWGLIDEDAYVRRFAWHIGSTVETFLDIGRSDIPLPDRHLPRAAEHGLLPLRIDGQLVWVVAPRGYAARRLSRLAASYPSIADRVRLTSRSRLNQFLSQQTGDALGHVASSRLHHRFPDMSAAPIPIKHSWWRHRLRHLSRVSLPAAPLILLPEVPLNALSIVLAIWFLAFNSMRLAGSFMPRRPSRKSRRQNDCQLPVYTIISALYHEATSVEALMQAITALDYPSEKLDIILVTEPDDLETRAAIARLGPMPHVQVLIAPAIGPRTKPKALNFALPFARGSFITVFDAEDRPEPNQLRDALKAFAANGADVACTQASLCIENLSDSWLSRMFAAEYAGQFDIFLPGFSVLRMPLPLGGSSNHFRTAILREVGGWDAYNVTEDADLGFRLARFGYRSVTFASTTFEEAPARFGGWLRQRSRWMKGWMQTWSVHMRAPARLMRECGPLGFLTLNIIVGGNVLTALAFPVLLLEILAYFVARALDTPWWGLLAGNTASLHLTAIAVGYLSTVIIGLMGLARRGQLRGGWIMALTPFYWGCLSIAAWRALFQLLKEPYRWEKTEHGLAQPSRQAFAAHRRARLNPQATRRVAR